MLNDDRTPGVIAAHQAADRPLTEEEMHDEKPLTRGQTTGNPEASRTASQDGGSQSVRDQLYAAVKYTLDQIQENPDLRYFAGWGTQVFYVLVRAEAAHLGGSVHDVEKARREDRQPVYRRREPEVLRLRDQIDELRAQLDGRTPAQRQSDGGW